MSKPEETMSTSHLAPIEMEANDSSNNVNISVWKAFLGVEIGLMAILGATAIQDKPLLENVESAVDAMAETKVPTIVEKSLEDIFWHVITPCTMVHSICHL